MRSFLKTCALLSATAALAACSLLPKPTPKAKVLKFPREDVSDGTKREPRKVGKVLMVNMLGAFVLIETGTNAAPVQGTALKTMRDGVETGVLTVSGERRGTVIAADITTGTPALGDDVML